MPSHTDTFGHLLNDYGRFPLLTPDQEISLARLIQRGRSLEAEQRNLTVKERREVKTGHRARQKLVQCNLRLVIHLSKKYVHRLRGNGMDHCDLVQEGVLGLTRAAELFDPTRGYKFSTYAYWWIRQALTRSSDQLDRLCRIPSHQIDILYRSMRESNNFEQKHGRQPTLKELANIVGKTESDLAMLLERDMLPCSLDYPMEEDRNNTLLNVLADKRKDDIDDRLELVLSYLGDLKPVEYETLCSVYELNGHTKKTHSAIAEKYGVSRERIRQHKERATNKLRRAIRQ